MTPNPTPTDLRRVVRDRYARAATETASCCAPACCGDEATSTSAAPVSRAVGYDDDQLADLPEGADLGLGCGNPTAIAGLAAGQTVLDLGSGAGIDCFLAAREVGPTGRVIGVDMTPEMIDRARANAADGGFDTVEFRLGEIEALPVADATVDVILSNCVLNLSPDKPRVLGEAFRVLKPGGRVVVSDLVSDRPVPELLRSNPDAVAGCLPIERDRYLAQWREAGFHQVRITSQKRYPAEFILGDPGVQAFLREHPEVQQDLAPFADGIYGAHFEAVKPS